MVWNELLHELHGFVSFLPLRLGIKYVNRVYAAGVALDIVFGNEVMNCKHAVVFELRNLDGVF